MYLLMSMLLQYLLSFFLGKRFGRVVEFISIEHHLIFGELPGVGLSPLNILYSTPLNIVPSALFKIIGKIIFS